MSLAHYHKFLWVRNKDNITSEEKQGKKTKPKREGAGKGTTTTLNLAAISSSDFIRSDQRSDLYKVLFIPDLISSLQSLPCIFQFTLWSISI